MLSIELSQASIVNNAKLSSQDENSNKVLLPASDGGIALPGEEPGFHVVFEAFCFPSGTKASLKSYASENGLQDPISQR